MLLDKRGDKAWHRRGEIARVAHQMDRGKFGLILTGKIGLDPGAQLFAGHIDIQHPDHRDRSAGDDAIPVRGGPVIG